MTQDRIFFDSNDTTNRIDAQDFRVFGVGVFGSSVDGAGRGVRHRLAVGDVVMLHGSSTMCDAL